MNRQRRVLLALGAVVVLVLVLGLVASTRHHSSTTTSEASGGPTETAAPIGGDAESSSADTQVDHPLRSFTFAATGDFLLHAPVQRQGAENAGGSGYSFAPMLTVTSPIISGVDLAICHMETPISEDDTSLSGYPVFNVPARSRPTPRPRATTDATPRRTTRWTKGPRVSPRRSTCSTPRD